MALGVVHMSYRAFLSIREGERRRGYLLRTRHVGLLARYDGENSPDGLEAATGGLLGARARSLARRVGVAFQQVGVTFRPMRR